MDVRGSFRDRHERIGEGRIGVGAFAEALGHATTHRVPLITETPGSGEAEGPCLGVLKTIRATVQEEEQQ